MADLKLDQPRGRHRQRHHHLRPHRPFRRRHPPLPRLGDQLGRHRRRLQHVDDATTATANTVPGAPTGLTATASGSSRDRPLLDRPDQQRRRLHQRLQDRGFLQRRNSTWNDRDADTGSTNTTYAHTGLSPGATRHYRVSAINSAGAGAVSNVDDATTEATDESGLALVCNMSMETVTVHEGVTAHFTIVINPALPKDDTLLWYVHDYGDATTPEDLPSTER